MNLLKAKKISFGFLVFFLTMPKGVFASFETGYQEPTVHALNSFQEGSYQDARDAIKQVVEGYPNEPKVLFWCGVLHVSEGSQISNRADFNIGVRCLEKTIAIQPSFDDAWGVLLSSLIEAGEYSTAIEKFEELWTIRELPSDDIIWTTILIVEPAYTKLNMHSSLFKFYKRLMEHGIKDDELEEKYIKLKEHIRR